MYVLFKLIRSKRLVFHVNIFVMFEVLSQLCCYFTLLPFYIGGIA
jgi:hypothetical protein